MASDTRAWRWLAVCAVLAMGINIGLHRLCEHSPTQERAPQARVSPKLALVLSGAHRPWMADFTWLRAVEHHGDPRMQALGHPLLLPLLERVATLDPAFVNVYHFLGTAIDYAGPAYERAMALLECGMQNCPHAWRIAFFAGFNAYYYARDYPRAAAHLAVAARSPEAPPHTAALATRLAAEAGLPGVGLQLVDTLLAQTQDSGTIEALQQRRSQLELDVQLRALQTLVRQWSGRHPGARCTWDALIDAGVLHAVPRDPWAAPLLLQRCEVVSIHNDRRLRLAPEAKGLTRASG